MTELRDVLAAEAARGGPVPIPLFEAVIARARHRRVVQISSLVVVALVVSAVVTIPTLVHRHRTPVVTADGMGATTEALRKAITEATANQLAAGVRMPVGAIAQLTAPTAAVDSAFSSPGTENLVDVVRYFTVPGTVDDLVGFVTAHPPANVIESGTESSNENGLPVTQGVMFTGLATHDYATPRVDVTAAKFGAGVAVRIDTQLVWRPLRTAAEQVPVDAPATLGGVALDHDATREVATFFNSLDAEAPGDRYCSPQTGGSRVIYATAHGSLAFDSSSCGGVVVTANGVRQPTLELPDAIPAGLQTFLGLSVDLTSAPDSSAGSSSAPAPASEAPASSPPR